MVSFSCEACNETMVKKKVAPHLSRCRAPVTCIDCSKTFPEQTFKDHNQCITEDQKYQGKYYKPKQLAKKPAPKVIKEDKDSKKVSNLKQSKPPTSANAKPTSINIEKKTSLKKILKKLSKQEKCDKKVLLERITVDTDGRLLLL